MKTYIRSTILLVSLAAATLPAQQSAPTVAQQWPASSSPSSPAATLDRLNEARYGTNAPSPWEQAGQVVFVVPSPDLTADGLSAITEDLAVMCRIFDKAVAPVQAAAAAGSMDPYGGDPFHPYGGRTLANRSRTQGLYLDGYGALFFVQVGFPLVAPSAEPEQPKTEPSADPLWAQTVNELQGSPQPSQPPATRAYDPQKVEDLKAALIKSFRHAANLRVRGPQDTIAVVITVQGGSRRTFSYATEGSRRGTVVQATHSASDASDVLILRTSKSDVDAFAKGALTADQFTGKVQVLRSWTNVGTEGGALRSTGSNVLVGPTLIVPSTNRR